MAQKLIICEHCGGEKLCKADHSRSCEVCRRAAGVGRHGRPTPVRCSFCGGHGRLWVEAEEEAAESPAEETAPEDAPAETPPAGE